AIFASVGVTAWEPSASSRDLKILLQCGSRLSWQEKKLLERSVRRPDSASRLAPSGAPAEAETSVVVANPGNSAGEAFGLQS
ncbi:hypothetical protein, partial [Halomonas sp. BC04]|uniref:hypothetical protein n=1 Tax=Halomonas sp. BC04 TaxID=1403540 RepID=UPI001E33450F